MKICIFEPFPTYGKVDLNQEIFSCFSRTKIPSLTSLFKDQFNRRKWKKIIESAKLWSGELGNMCYFYSLSLQKFGHWVLKWFPPKNYSLKYFEKLMHPRRPRGNQSGREKRRDESFQVWAKEPRVPTLTKLFPNIQANAGSWLGPKNALYYCAQSANSVSWVLFASLYTTAIVSPHLPSLFTKLVLARKTFIFYFPNQKRRNYPWVEKTFRMLSAGAIQFAPWIFCFWLITMHHK